MADESTPTTDFISQVTAIIEQNLANEQFGVSELADALNMSRSNLLRKIKKETRLSVSQLINQVRLKRAMELLRKSSFNVSEVSVQVGFNSTSYFIKCFREYYGYPPGEVGKRGDTEPVVKSSRPGKTWAVIGLVGVIAVALLIYALRDFSFFGSVKPAQKSIAVLPFKNESSDSTNVYLINGLMESTLGNLQKIKNLRVISRTSTEKYRNARKSIPEMAKELGVTYFVEGSGQKIGDQILLNVQLIDASTDRHLWSSHYKREAKDIFQLQEDIANNIVREIEAFITPEEQERIEKKPTENLAAYDLFLKGKDFEALGGKPNLAKAITFFKAAIAKDPEFALAHAEAAFCYYNVEIFQAEKIYPDSVEFFADKAFLLDSHLGESLVAKAVAYMAKKKYTEAVPYLEKALEYNPNSTAVLGLLTDFYAIFIPDTGKYLKYALQGVKLDVASMDSVAASYNYLRLGNALVQNGFVDESLRYLDKSLDYNPKNPFSRYVRAFVLMAKTGDGKKTRDLLLIEYNKDTSRFDILQDIGKVSYYMRDYQGAYYYYKKFVKYRESHKLDVYHHEDMIIGFIYDKAGDKEKAKELFTTYKQFVDRDKSVYQNLGKCGYYIYFGDDKKAIEYMKLFAKEDNVQYWVYVFIEGDPIIARMSKNPEFKKYLDEATERFWRKHNEMKEDLEDQLLL